MDVNEWRDVKDKPSKFLQIQMLCGDGKIRSGVFDPEFFLTPWIYDHTSEDVFIRPKILKWRQILDD